MDKTCFAYITVDTGCRALTDSSGCGPACPFRKTAAELEASQRNADRRLASLPRDRQTDIAQTYFMGVRPWLRTTRKAVGV